MKYKLPRSIRVGCFDITIKYISADLANALNHWGNYCRIENLICISEDVCTNDRLLEVLLHEIGHAIWYTYNLVKDDNEERIVSTSAVGWAQVFRDSPELVKLISKLSK